MDQEKSGKCIAKRCVTGCVLIVLSLLICGPAFAVEFKKTNDGVQFETDAPGVEITVNDYFGHTVESVVVRLQGPSPYRWVVPGAVREIVKDKKAEVVKIKTIKEGRFSYQVKYNGLFKVQVRDLTAAELSYAEGEAAEKLPCIMCGFSWGW